MSKIKEYMDQFFGRVNATAVYPPTPDELVDGKSFQIVHIPVKPYRVTHGAGESHYVVSVIHENGKEIARATEKIDVDMTINTMSFVRFNDSLGFKHAVGVIFGERRTP